MSKVYLKPNIVIEPLFDRWYAWSHLISPATSALNTVHRHMEIMSSYIRSPHIHAAAVKNPKMLGGPFMDYPANRVDDVKALKEKNMERQREVISFSESIKALNNMLKENAKGFSLESLYDKVPEDLKGFVELKYDLNNQPSFRFFEPLLYKSKHYNKNSQSIALWETSNDHRPFVLSTPRLNEEHVLHLDIPFDHPFIDAISAMKRHPNDLKTIKEMVEIPDEKLFDTFFTLEKPSVYQPYTGDKIRMRYFGHACILIETKEVSILVDPLISYYGYHSDVDHYSDADLPDVIDYVLITHNHQDHILFETLLPLRHKIMNIVVPRNSGGELQDPSLKLMFNNIGFNNVIEIDDMQALEFKDCKITGIPFLGEHSDLDIKSKICHHVQIGQFKVLFVADSRILEKSVYQHVHSIVGDIDVLLLGMECDGAPLSWLYGPLLFDSLARDKDNSRRLSGSNYEKGMHLVDIFSPLETYVYAMGQEPWVEFISSIKYTEESNPIVASNKLIAECKNRGIVAERLFGEKELLYGKRI
jgi:L-ascorbate metabolism protein UlaG (beta-lactamase superfamily)